eukprot:12271493-Alexandrium_andersonii.AAC.1
MRAKKGDHLAYNFQSLRTVDICRVGPDCVPDDLHPIGEHFQVRLPSGHAPIAQCKPARLGNLRGHGDVSGSTLAEPPMDVILREP